MILYAVVDKKAKALVTVFTSINDESAKRSFLSLLTGFDNIFSQFPEDFALFACADIIVNGSNVLVSRPGSEALASAGSTAEQFHLYDPLDDGSNYDKRYLAMVHQDRVSYEVLPDAKLEEDK